MLAHWSRTEHDVNDPRETIAQAVDYHQQRNSCCSCMAWQADWQEGHVPFTVQHRAHVTDAILAALAEGGWTITKAGD